MERWLAAARAEGLQPRVAMPEPLALPLSADAWTVVLEDDRAVVRTGTAAGFGCDLGMLAPLIGLTLESAGDDRPERLTVYAQGDPPEPEPGWPRMEHHPLPPGGLLALSARGLTDRPGINLLQGPYGPSTGLSRRLRPWRAAAALLAAWILVQGIGTGLEYRRLQAQQEQLTQAIEQVFRQTFPEARRVVNPRVQMEQRLRELGSGGEEADPDFLEVLATTARLIETRGGIEVNAASYRIRRLDVELDADSLQNLDTLKQDLQSEGLEAEIVSASSEGGRISGRLRIEVGTG
jgi:general secretion pathway protein L